MQTCLDAAQCPWRHSAIVLTKDLNREVLMPELSKVTANDPLLSDISLRLAQSNKHIIDLLLGAQKLFLEDQIQGQGIG